MKILFFSLILFTSAFCQEVPEIFYKRFEGSINDRYNFTMNLIRVDSVLSGSYYYNNKGEIITFTRSSIDSAGSIYLEEDGGYDEKDQMVTTGIFKGKFVSDKKIEGTWEKPGSKDVLNFSAEEKYPSGAAEAEIIHREKSYSKYGTATVELTYFKVLNLENSTAGKINNYLEAQLLYPVGLTDDTAHYKNIQSLIDEFITGYETDVVADSAINRDYTPMYDLDRSSSIVFNSNNILSLENIDYSFLGGAHPTTFINLTSFNLVTGNVIKLDDIFKPGYRQKLNAAGEKKFREFYKLSPNESLEDAGFWFEKGFDLNDNFLITTTGIRFLFNQYEVAPYALGAPEVYIPFREIQDILKEKSIIKQP